MRNLVVSPLSWVRLLPAPITPEAPHAGRSQAFIDRAQAKLAGAFRSGIRADWVKSTFITYDTEILAAKADEQPIAATMQLAKESTRFSQSEDAGGHWRANSSCCGCR